MSDKRFNATTLDAAQRRSVFEALLRQAAHHTAGATPAQRWAQLEAAHVVGQTVFSLHLRSHLAMFGLARQTRDVPEMAGQLLRLALVPLGHALDRLPAGNTGRSNVNAFRPMGVTPAMAALIQEIAAGAQDAATAFRPPRA